MLVVLPLGLFTGAVVFDLVYVIGNNQTFSQVGFWDITAGIIGGLLAALAGLVDYLGVSSGTRAKAVGVRHGLLNVVVVVLFLISWLIRRDAAGHSIGIGVFILEAVAFVLAGASAWLGGELVERHGLSVDPEADLNAPSSLTAATRR